MYITPRFEAYPARMSEEQIRRGLQEIIAACEIRYYQQQIQTDDQIRVLLRLFIAEHQRRSQERSLLAIIFQEAVQEAVKDIASDSLNFVLQQFIASPQPQPHRSSSKPRRTQAQRRSRRLLKKASALSKS
jgi:hypothetical protein